MKKLSRSVYTPISNHKKILRRLSDNDPSLVRIVFSSRNLGSPGVRALSRALSANTCLREIDLSSNDIGSEGARCLAALLQHQTNNMIASSNMSEESGGGITTVVLGDNNLRDAGVIAMAEALASNILLEALCIDDNFIGAAGLALLSEALKHNSRLKRLHIHHNSFQSLASLITCTFDKGSLDSVSDSNHTLRHVFLNCGYSYECEELEAVLSINRMGKVEARRTKLALFLGEDLGELLEIDLDPKLMPGLLGILAPKGHTSTLFRVMTHLSSEILSFRGLNHGHVLHCDDPMDVEDLLGMDVEHN